MEKPKSAAPSPPSPPHAATANGRSLDNLKSLLIKCANASGKSLTPPQKAFIDSRIQQIFPNIHTPDHPPYAWMIENAIRQLNEKGGSSEESVSKFILKEHQDLPFAHTALLKHHLEKCVDLVKSHNGCYSIGKSSPSPSPSPSPSSDPSYCFSHAYESSSSESFSPKKGKCIQKKKKRKNRKKTRNARKIVTNQNSGRACQVSVDQENEHPIECVALENIVFIDIGASDGENRADGERIEWLQNQDKGSVADDIPLSRRKKWISVRKNFEQNKKVVRPRRMTEAGKRRGRTRKRDMPHEECGNNNNMIVQAEGDEDTLDKLIEEVYAELKGNRYQPTQLNQMYEIIDLETTEPECHLLTDEAINNQFQQGQEANEIGQELRLEKGEIEIIGQINTLDKIDLQSHD
ncbi:histone H1/H5 family protein [Striga asiatica]|uniref:Histone H1/H5 family protein n=1 Tax=Striga asiatica TaxID=4170 RepID=A0A5A7QTX8_STRAF|nr:histone H1/H5 family protein [Striga asiatica]